MYRLARRGEAPEIPEREVEIFEISQLSCLSDDTFKIDVHVSKGTYIRSLAHDIGEYLGCGACLSAPPCGIRRAISTDQEFYL